MPIYYDNRVLSSRKLRSITVKITALGMTTGILFYDSLIAGFSLTVLLSFLFPKYKKTAIENEKNRLLIQFRDMLYSVSSSVSSGRTMGQALEESIDFWRSTYEEKDYIMRELRYMTGQIRNSNERDTVVLMDFAKRSGLDDIMDFVRVYESCKGTGGNMQQAINRAATIIGDKINLERELTTLMSQKIFESRVVASAPFAIVLLLRIVAPEYLAPMIETSSGKIIITFALGLMVIAFIMMERINSIEI